MACGRMEGEHLGAIATIQQKLYNKIMCMKLSPKRKILFMAVAACIVFSLLSMTLTTEDYDHDCVQGRDEIEHSEVNCFVCLKIELAKNLIKTFRPTDNYSFFADHLMNSAKNHQKYSDLNASFLLVAQKIQFNC